MSNEIALSKRPVTISKIAVNMFVEGLIFVILDLVVIVLTLTHVISLEADAFSVLLVSGPLAVIAIVLGWGLWRLKRWSFWGTIFFSVLQVLVGLFYLFYLFSISPKYVTTMLVVFIVLVAMPIYTSNKLLRNAELRQMFRK